MLVFDREYSLKNPRIKKIAKETAKDGSDISHHYLNVGTMSVTEPGYVYIYGKMKMYGHHCEKRIR